ncbi:MAG: caspase family protein [Myxococcota bacterium]
MKNASNANRAVIRSRVLITAFMSIAVSPFIGCVSMGSGGVDARIRLSEMDIVDCTVEGAVRQIGRNFAYQEPPRIARISEFECASLGGTFVIYDPAAPNVVIEKWLPFAEGGDVSAQHRLGLLYEGVMGAEADYGKAAHWYGEAAKAGHRESIYALSVFYEKGLGVERDLLRAIELYREASGLKADRIMFSSDAYQQIEELKGELAKEIASVSGQRDALQSQLERQKSQLAALDAEKKTQAASLSALVSQLDSQVETKKAALASLPAYRLLHPPDTQGTTRFDFPDLPSQSLRDRGVGKFYALVIGNNHYEHLLNLETAKNDATAVAGLLAEDFGFSTQLLLDANEEDTKRAIYNIFKVAEPEDNVLIYFAGHGHVKEISERSRRNGFWLPTNADAEQDVNWIDNWWITNHLDTSKVRRALIIADSCYGGVFSTDLPIGPVTRLPPLSDEDFDQKLQRKSRFVLASGGIAPVIDLSGPEEEHSVFASAFIEVLEGSSGTMSIVEFYGRIFDLMYSTLARIGLNQEPELRVVRAAGHQSEGDFFFVRNER